MAEGKKLITHIFNYGLGGILTKVISFLLVPLYTLYLTPEDFGRVEIVMSIGLFLAVLMRIGLPGAITRYFFDYENQPEELGRYISSIFWLTTLSSIIVALMAFYIYPLLQIEVYRDISFYPFIFLMILYALFLTPTDIQRRLMQAREESRKSATLTVITSAFIICLSVIFVIFLRWGAAGLVLATTIATGIFFIQSLWYLRKDVKLFFSTSYLKSSFKYSLGILPHHIVVNLSPIFSKTLLVYFTNLSALGVYSMAYKFTTPLNLLSNAFLNGFMPLYFRFKKDAEDVQKMKELLRRIVIITAIIAFLFNIAAPDLLKLFTTSRFHDGSKLLFYFGISFLISVPTTIYDFEIYYSQKTYWIPVTTIAFIVIENAVIYFSVSSLQIYSLVAGMMVTTVVVCVLKYWIGSRIAEVPFDWIYFFKSLLIVTAISVFYNLYPFNNEFHRMIGAFLCIALFFGAAWAWKLLTVNDLKGLKTLFQYLKQ